MWCVKEFAATSPGRLVEVQGLEPCRARPLYRAVSTATPKDLKGHCYRNDCRRHPIDDLADIVVHDSIDQGRQKVKDDQQQGEKLGFSH